MKTPTGAGYAQGTAGETPSPLQGILPVPSGQGNPDEEAGYAQGQAVRETPAGSQDIEPDVSSGQGEVLDNTNVESVQLRIIAMTRGLFA